MHTAINTLCTPPPWFPEPGTVTFEAVRANRDVAGFVRVYFEEHPGALSEPCRAALRISELYGVDACEVLLLIFRILER